MAHKRKLRRSHSAEDEEPLLKRQRKYVNTTTGTEISSIFTHPEDQTECAIIFNAVWRGQLGQTLHVINGIPIVFEIAEYATGQLHKCASSDCDTTILSLMEHKQKYNHTNHTANKLPYRWCKNTNTFFCEKCMHETVEHACGRNRTKTLQFEGDLYQCNCGGGMYDGHGGAPARIFCRQCDDNDIVCQLCECAMCSESELLPCIGCEKLICENLNTCNQTPDGWEDYYSENYCVCEDCLDLKLYKCDTCNEDCCGWFSDSIDLEFKYFWNEFAVQCTMVKCHEPSCKVIICLKCKNKTGENVCEKKDCIFGYFCIDHFHGKVCTFCVDADFRGNKFGHRY